MLHLPPEMHSRNAEVNAEAGTPQEVKGETTTKKALLWDASWRGRPMSTVPKWQRPPTTINATHSLAVLVQFFRLFPL